MSLRVVLDTNVLVSGLLSENGPPGQILDLLLSSQLILVFDNPILSEYMEVLARPKFNFDSVIVSGVFKVLEKEGVLISTPPPWPHTLPDPDDEIFLAVAKESEVILITGNLVHYPVKTRGGVKVFTPREFIEHLKKNPIIHS